MRRTAVPLLAGLIVFSLLTYWGGCNDSQPPVCFGMFGWYSVPSDGWIAPIAGLATTVLVWFARSSTHAAASSS